MKTNFIFRFALSVGLMLSFGGCNRDTTDNVGPDSENAVFMNVNINAPDGFVNYVGVFPDVPTNLDKSKLVEIGRDAHVSFPYKGSVFAYSGTTKALSRWEVDRSLNLSRTATLGLSNQSLPGYPAIAIHSDTRGFIFNLENGKVIEFNPKEMTITTEINVPKPERPYAYMGFLPVVHNNRIVGNLNETDWDNRIIQNRVGVVSFDVNTRQLTYHYDTRSTTGYEYFADSKGFFYTLPDMWNSAFMRNFGNNRNAPKTQLLRFDINNNRFDPSYNWPIEDILGGYTVNFYLINDTKAFVSYIPKPLPARLTPDNMWTEAKAKVKMFDLVTGRATDIPGLTGEYNSGTAGEGRYVIDGTLYVPMSIRVGDQLTTRIYKITESGATVHSELSNTWISEISRLR